LSQFWPNSEGLCKQKPFLPGLRIWVYLWQAEKKKKEPVNNLRIRENIYSSSGLECFLRTCELDSVEPGLIYRSLKLTPDLALNEFHISLITNEMPD